MAKESRLSQFQRNETATTTSVVAASYEGPLPHPQILRQYDDLLPGLANRIVKMVEEEGIHRRGIEKIEQQHAHDMDKRYLNSIVGTERWGQIFGFLIGIAGLASASYVAVQWRGNNR